MRPELHPACAAFPPLPAAELRALAADIKSNGLLDPITLCADGRLLDGRSRWDACEMAGVAPRSIVYDGDDPITFVLSRNRYRRHLTKSQKAMVVARLATLSRGNSVSNILKKHITQPAAELSKQADVPLAYTNYGRIVLKAAEPHIVQMVDDGEVNVRIAAEAVRNADRSMQASWRKLDVEREGKKVVNAYPSNQKGAKPAQNSKAKSPKMAERIDIPYNTIKFPTPEETGFPIGGDLHEQFAHHDRYGRTPLHPQAVKHMLEHDSLIVQALMPIIKLAGQAQPEAETIFTCLDAMLAWQPDKERGKGFETDFAGKARRHLNMLDRVLETAARRLTDLQKTYRARRMPREVA